MAKGKESGSGTTSGEVSNGFWSCRDISDIVPLHTPHDLYLKPVAKINVSVSLPQLKAPGKTISTWDVMEKIRHLIRPDEFGSLKVSKSTLEFIRLEGDVRDRSRLKRVLARLDSQYFKLEGFPSTLKVRAAETKDDFPTRHSWDSYFRDAKHMNELKAGERPDTIHISGLPVKWFCEEGAIAPSEAFVKKVFSKWGIVRRVDVPAADPYRARMRLGQNIHKFSYEDGLFFDAYVQYIEYMDFVRAMDALRGMKLLKKEGQNNYLTATVKVNFDKTKHMSDNSVSHRAFERKRLIAQDNLAAEKIRKREEAENKKKEEQRKKEEADYLARETRRRKREEKRKRKALTVFRKQEEDKVSLKIAREERKLIKAQRQLESIRLLDELFDRIKTKIEKKEIDIEIKSKVEKKVENEGNKSLDSNDPKEDEKKDKKSKKKKAKCQKKKRKKNKKGKDSNDDLRSNSDEETNKKKLKSVSVKSTEQNSVVQDTTMDTGMPYPAMYPRFPTQPWYYDAALPVIYPHSTRGFSRDRRGHGSRGRGRGTWRGDNHRGLNSFNSQLFYNKQYYKYFASLAGQDYHDFESDYERSSRSRSRRLTKSRSRSHSRSRSRRRRRKHKSRSRSRSRSRSSSRSKTRSRSRNRSRRSRKSRSKSRSRTRSRNNRSSSRVKITRAKSRSKSPKQKSRSSSWSLPKTPTRRSCSWSKSVDEKT